MNISSNTTINLTDARLAFIRPDTSFLNFWDSRSGRKETGGTATGDVRIKRLSFNTCRQLRLTAAGHDKAWWSIKVPGKAVVHVCPDTLIIDLDTGLTYTMAEFWVSLLLAL